MGESSPRLNTPRWGNTTKLIVGLSFVGVFVILLINFRSIVGPLLISVIFSYLLYPLADFLRKKLHFSWRLSVNLIFLVVLIILLALLTWGGLALIEQVQSLVKFLQTAVKELPKFIQDLNQQALTIGPFKYSLDQVDLNAFANQLLGSIQPILSQAGVILGTIASSAAVTIGWMFFILMIAYFMLSESEGTRSQMIKFDIPGYKEEISRISQLLAQIWNAFLRGQLIIMLIAIVIYVVVLGILGVNYYYGLALLAGMARFVPYVGAWVTWGTVGLVSFFQGSTIMGLDPTTYALIMVGVTILIDSIVDNLVSPRILSNALRVHPAAVLVAAMVGASLLGLIGVILAAPVLATLKLLVDYATLKMFDRDPWPELERHESVPPKPLFFRKFFKYIFHKIFRKSASK